MADPYDPPTLTGYNATPPADDGTEVDANKVTWAKIKEKLTDPLKTFVESMNTKVNAAFDTVSSLFFSTTVKAVDYTVLTTDGGELFLWDTTTARTATLPAAASAGNGFRVSFKKTTSDTNTLTIDGNASETIDGATTITLAAQYETVSIVCDGSNWHTGVFDGPRYAVGQLTRDLTAASGNVAYTGVGFRPKAIIIIGAQLSAASRLSWGMADASSEFSIIFPGSTTPTGDSLVAEIDGGGAGQQASLASFDTDGFTLTWTEVGAPGSATLTFNYLAFG